VRGKERQRDLSYNAARNNRQDIFFDEDDYSLFWKTAIRRSKFGASKKKIISRLSSLSGKAQKLLLYLLN
jgi:hypothetical protein